MAVRSVYVSEGEYLQAERQASAKSEYLAGQVFAMAGASIEHAAITLNIAAELLRQIRHKGCHVYAQDVRVKVTPASAYFYPDVVVVCGTPQVAGEQRDTLLNPVLIVEVLSPSTEEFDRGEKFFAYQKLDSLREYLLVSQDRVHVEQFVRQADGLWQRREYTQPEQVVQLESVGAVLPLRAVYEGVVLPSS
ncbi:MAG: Uma2 family endonuclease [Armatimonadota bacterium]|nr:Uma2 family endonuclease [Armatimonadota bacterium]